MNIDEKMQRLTRWMLVTEQPEPLDLDHEAQKDFAWAADEILRLRAAIMDALEHQPYMATKAAEVCTKLRRALHD
jgi:hypothetical protein